MDDNDHTDTESLRTSVPSRALSPTPSQFTSSTTLPPYSSQPTTPRPPPSYTSRPPPPLPPRSQPVASSASSLPQWRATDYSHDRRRKLLVIYIHGFMGAETSFQDFPRHVHDLASILLGNSHVVHTKIYPRYKSKDAIQVARDHFSVWLAPHESPNTDIILCGHSLGGILAAEVALLKSNGNIALKHHIIGTISFDTPFLGMHPGIIGAGISSLFSTNHTPAKSPQVPGTPQSPFAPPGPDPYFNTAFSNDVRLPIRSGWANALNFVMGSTKDLKTATTQLIKSYADFGACLADYDGLKDRYRRIRILEEDDETVRRQILKTREVPRVRFVNYFTVSTGRLKKTPAASRSAHDAASTSPELDKADKRLAEFASSAEAPLSLVSSPEEQGRRTSTSSQSSFYSLSSNESTIGAESHTSQADLNHLEPRAVSPSVAGSDHSADPRAPTHEPPPVPTAFPPMPQPPPPPTSHTATDIEAYNKSLKAYEASFKAYRKQIKLLAKQHPPSSTTYRPILPKLPPLPPLPAIPPMPPLPPLIQHDPTDPSSHRAAERAQRELEKAQREAEQSQHLTQRETEKHREKAERVAAKSREKADREAAHATEKAERELEKANEKTQREARKHQEKVMKKHEKAQRAAALAAEKAAIQAAKSHGKSGLSKSTSTDSAQTQTPAGPARQGTEEIKGKEKAKRDRTFCVVPPVDGRGMRDPCWSKVFMKGVDEVGAHCGLFFTQDVDVDAVGDVEPDSTAAKHAPGSVDSSSRSTLVGGVGDHSSEVASAYPFNSTASGSTASFGTGSGSALSATESGASGNRVVEWIGAPATSHPHATALSVVTTASQIHDLAASHNLPSQHRHHNTTNSEADDPEEEDIGAHAHVPAQGHVAGQTGDKEEDETRWSERYAGFVQDVATRIEGWVLEAESVRVARMMG